MATVKEFRMSQERYDELKHELEYSKTTRADEIAELIKEARGFGETERVPHHHTRGQGTQPGEDQQEKPDLPEARFYIP